MILMRDAWRLALTKLQIRKVRLVITVLVASLLFAAAIFAVTVVRGATGSVMAFNKEGLSNRFFASGTAQTPASASDPNVVAFVEAEQGRLEQRKKTESNRLGMGGDTRTGPRWVDKAPDGTKFVNQGNPEAAALIKQYQKDNLTSTSFASFEQAVKKAGAINAYRIAAPYSGGMSADNGQSKVVVAGKEEFKEKTNNPDDAYKATGFKTIESAPIRFADDELVKNFTLPGQDFSYSQGSYPSFVPFSVAEQALGLQALASDAKPSLKLERLAKVRSEIAGKTISICYRNSSSLQKIDEAIRMQLEIENNKNTKDYQKPDLVYGLPNQACGELTIAQDNRSPERRSADNRQAEFEALFGKASPSSKLVNIRVVGLVPDMAGSFSSNTSGILASIVMSSVGGGWIMPTSAASQPTMAGIVADINGSPAADVQFIAELPTAAAQKKFIKEHSCDLSTLGDTGQSNDQQHNQPYNQPNSQASAAYNLCSAQHKLYVYQTFGNNAAAIQEFRQGFDKVFNIVLLVVAAISSVIMMGVIARIIADSRRETAVFRAIGATRLDMSLVYGIYAVILATLVVVVATVLGWLGAVQFSAHFGPIVTPDALLVFNSMDLQKSFTFVAFDGARIIKIIAVAYVATLLGLLLPLTANLRRSPLKDMRDEN